MKINKDEERSQESGVRSHLTPALSPKGGEGVKRLEWWESLTLGERKLICSLMRMLRGAKQSELRDVAIAAAKWERGIGCFIKVRLIGQAARGQRFTQRRQGAVCITVGNTSSAAEPRPGNRAPNDSLAPAHSALGGPSSRKSGTNSFRHFPSGGSPQRGEGGAQGTDRPTASPSTSRSQRGVSPSQG